MSSLNQCQFIGNLGADPEIRSMNNGNNVANFRIACTEKWKDRGSGERKEKTEWVSIVVFGPLVNVVQSYLKKGSKVFLSGAYTTRKWQDQNGQDRYSTEIVLQGPNSKLIMLDSAGGSVGGGSYDNGGGGVTVGSGAPPTTSLDDDEIPF